MAKTQHPIETALRTGSRAKNFSKKISDACAGLPDSPADIRPEALSAIVSLAAACRATKAVAAALRVEGVAAADDAADFRDLFCESYYPVIEDNMRTVAFWSVKDRAILAANDVHEWVRDTKFDEKTKQTVKTVVPFGAYWQSHRPDYELYGVASDRSKWRDKVIDVEGRRCVNTVYGQPSVLESAPAKYGDGREAEGVLNAALENVITDADPENALRKRRKFVVDAGAHLLSLRDGGDFRCRKVFCFTSTNKGQGTGKSLLQESIAALVPRDAACTVPTTQLATNNLLPLYSSSVCILTEAPSTSTERYTSEDIKAFADAGWKTATNKFVALRSVNDSSLKLLSSNHLSPLPVDSPTSRRLEFFVSAVKEDNGAELRAMLDGVQRRTGWTCEELRACVGWALLLLARRYMDEGDAPFATARRTIDAEHLLTVQDYDYFVVSAGNVNQSYSDYKDTRTDWGFTWTPDRYRFNDLCALSRSREAWVDGAADTPPPPPPPPEGERPEDTPPGEPPEEEEAAVEPTDEGEACVGSDTARAPTMQFKRCMSVARLEPEQTSVAGLYAYVVGDAGLKGSTAAVRAGEADKRKVLRQVFPGTLFDKYSRTENIASFTGLTHVDFDAADIEKSEAKPSPEEIRDTLAGLPGFVIGAVSARGKGAWAIFNAGTVKDYDAYLAASRSLFALAEEAVCVKCDEGTRLPTTGRTVGHDPDCRVCDEALAGGLPEPYRWKASSFKTAGMNLGCARAYEQQTPDERVRNEKFMEAVVSRACERIQAADEGGRHGVAVSAVANVVMCCRERGMAPLSSWGRRLHDACLTVGLDRGEAGRIMAYWRQKTGVSC